MIKEYIIEKFSKSCVHLTECINDFMYDDDFKFCETCDFKDFLLNCNRTAMLIEEGKDDA